MAIYSENKVSSVTTTRQDEVPIYGSDRLGLVRRNLELDDQTECPYCPVPQTIAPGMLRIVEVLYDSPLSNPTEVHTGEFVVLRNATGLTLPLASISVTYPGGVFTFGAADVLAPYEFAIVANWTGSPGSFATQYGLAGYNTDPKVNWFWDNAMTLPDAGGAVNLLDFTDGVPTLLDAVIFGGSGITASNAYCATACSTAQTVQLDNFLTSPPGAFDAGEWAAATITGKGTIGSGAFVLDNSYARELGSREYELKDHLGNVRVVVSDKKLSDIVSGLPEDFRAEVLTMRDYYAFGMDLPGAVFTGSSGYRYGFNGMERDDEVKGAGMSYDFGARVYDPRVGRWWSCDPLEGNYPQVSPFTSFGNNPLMYLDPGGESLQVAGNLTAAFQDIQMLLQPGNERGLIKITENGEVIWTAAYYELSSENKKAMAQSNAGFALVDALINSAGTYRHEVVAPQDNHVQGRTRYFENGDPNGSLIYMPEFDRIDPVKVGDSWLDSFQNLNINPHYGAQGPIEGLNAHTIFPNMAYLRSAGGSNVRPGLIFHELLESFIMCEGATELLNSSIPVGQRWSAAKGLLSLQESVLSVGKPITSYHGKDEIDGFEWGAHEWPKWLEGNFHLQKNTKSGYYNYAPGGGGNLKVTQQMLDTPANSPGSSLETK